MQQFVKNNKKQRTAYDKDSLSEIEKIINIYDDSGSTATIDYDEMTDDNSPVEITSISTDTATITERPESGRVEETFNKHLEQSTNSSDTVNIEFEEYYHIKPFRYMNDKIGKKSEVLENSMDQLIGAIIEQHELEAPSIFHVPAQDSFIAVGRICSETEGKLSTESNPPTLESTRANGNKVRVRLALQSAEEYSIFPGQVVALEGKNPTGKLLVATKLYDGARLPFYTGVGTPSPPSVSVVVACGPWNDTHSSSVNNYLLKNLLREVKKNPPHAIILIGPFVDSNNKLIASAAVEKTFDQLMDSTLQQIKQEIAHHFKHVIIVPSLADAHHDDVYPQPPFRSPETQPFLFAPNPCIIKMEGVTVAVTAVDILRHMSAEEISSQAKSNASIDRRHKLCQHLINQRSFYPLFPPDPTTNVDSSHYQQLQFPYTPDVLIVPSDLQHFVKNVDGVLCINPGRASKGTYARFTITNDQQNRVVDRTRVDITRI